MSFPCCPYCEQWKRRAIRSENFFKKTQIQDALTIAIDVLEGRPIVGEQADHRDYETYTKHAAKWLKGLL